MGSICTYSPSKAARSSSEGLVVRALWVASSACRYFRLVSLHQEQILHSSIALNLCSIALEIVSQSCQHIHFSQGFERIHTGVLTRFGLSVMFTDNLYNLHVSRLTSIMNISLMCTFHSSFSFLLLWAMFGPHPLMLLSGAVKLLVLADLFVR